MKWAFTVMLCSFLGISSQAQFTSENVWVSIFQQPAQQEIIETSEADTLLDPFAAIDNLSYFHMAFVAIEDSLLVDSIVTIDVSLFDGSSLLSSNAFTYDATPPSPFTFSREEGNIYLGMGSFDLPDSLGCVITIHGSQGSNTVYNYGDSTE